MMSAHRFFSSLKRSWYRRLLRESMTLSIAFTMLALSAAHAATLKTESTVTGESVTVGDVFDGAGEYASRYLAPAPAAGEVLALNTFDLTRISDAFSLGWQPPASGAHVMIHAETNTVDRYAIEAALQEKLVEDMRGQKFDMELQDHAISLRLPAGADKTITVENMKIDLQKGRFQATMTVSSLRKDVSGRIYLIAQIPVLKSAISKGAVIDAHDLEYIDIRASDVSASMIVDAEKLIGQSPRRGIAAMKPLTASDIEAPLMVKRGDLVTIALKNGALNLTVQGRAMQNGTEGEVVRVVNTASNRALEAIVTGTQSVTVQSPSSAL